MQNGLVTQKKHRQRVHRRTTADAAAASIELIVVPLIPLPDQGLTLSKIRLALYSRKMIGVAVTV